MRGIATVTAIGALAGSRPVGRPRAEGRRWSDMRTVAAIAVLLAVSGNAAFAQEHKTYRCKVADVVNWADDGRLRLNGGPRSGTADYMRQVSDGVIIDTLTGAITYPDGRREQWNVGKRGDRNNDYVLTHTNPPFLPDIPLEKALALAASDFIRIRAWGEKPMPVFLAFFLGDFVSGPCEVVR